MVGYLAKDLGGLVNNYTRREDEQVYLVKNKHNTFEIKAHKRIKIYLD